MNELTEAQIRVAKKFFLLARDIATIDGITDGYVNMKIQIHSGEPVDVTEDCKKEAIAMAQSPANEW